MIVAETIEERVFGGFRMGHCGDDVRLALSGGGGGDGDRETGIDAFRPGGPRSSNDGREVGKEILGRLREARLNGEVRSREDEEAIVRREFGTGGTRGS